MKNIYPYNLAYKLETSGQTGFIKINIVNQKGGEHIPNATITVYVTDGMRRDVPIMHLITSINPIRIELPIAYKLGTQLMGPEYSFSTYNLRVDAFGYFANEVYNIRIFPDTTISFDIEMISISQMKMVPALEERTDIPPHPRDLLN